MRRAILVSLILVSVPTGARAENALRFIPPVDAPIASSFVAPASDYAAGHRGIDYSTAVGTRVRAIGAGVVAFAGSAAGTSAVTIDHGSGVVSTYTGLTSIDVRVGESVTEGRFIGSTGSVHGEPGLHLGVKRHGVYVDPVSVLGDIDLSAAIHLAPVQWTPDELGALGSMLEPSAGTSTRECRPNVPLASSAVPPNDNVAVAVAGITSKTKGGVSADIYEHGPETLGYRIVYRFSYAGTRGPDAHKPYERSETYVDIRVAARRLRVLMRRIADVHPGRSVDLIAHSQGGVVARTYLALVAGDEQRLPPVDHLVTFATPHRGAPAAGEVEALRDRTMTGPLLLHGAKTMSQRGLPVPDPMSPAVRQLAPGSRLMGSLADEDVSFGTRVLALAIPNDPVVPADHALYPGEQGRVVPWTGRGLGGHSAIVTSEVARGIAYAFLSDRAPTCTTSWDRRGLRFGALWSGLEASLAETLATLERTVLPVWLRP